MAGPHIILNDKDPVEKVKFRFISWPLPIPDIQVQSFFILH
jgi:hypothetical protein